MGWTGMDYASSTRAAEDRTRWKEIVVKSSLVPQRPHKIMGYTRLDPVRPSIPSYHRKIKSIYTSHNIV